MRVRRAIGIPGGTAWTPVLLWLCPGCIEGAGPEVYRGFLLGMGLLMAAPLLLVGIIGGGLFRARRRAMREQVERLVDETSGRDSGEV